MRSITCAVVFSLLVLVLHSLHCKGQTVLTANAFSKSNPSFFAQQGNSLASPNTGLWGDVNKAPYPTNEWWTNLVLNQGASSVKTFPYLIQAMSDGLRISFPGRTVAQTFIFETFLENISFRCREGFNGKKLRSYSKFSATLRYTTANSNAYMDTPLVRGMAYVTAIYSNLSPVINTIHAILSINGQGATQGQAVSGTKFVLTFNNGQRWIVYSSQSITFTLSGSQLQATSPFNGYLMVVMATQAQESIYDKHRGTYPVDAVVTTSIQFAPSKLVANQEQNDIATIEFQYKKVGSSPLLLFALPHHLQSMDPSSIVYTNPMIQMKTIRGQANLIIGDTWVLKEKLTNIGFYSKYLIPNNEKENLKAALLADRNQMPVASDPYFYGKQIAKLGRLALIADELGETAVASQIRSNMKQSLNVWFDSSNPSTMFVYDNKWGGIVTKSSMGSPNNDFGMGLYNGL